ncbi:hypothetical protein PACILC2_39470 [Paenibacillus cisolokensis]|uniref:Uncharacterized protein n=1 Tax=Paenibacillus cisolokensis TaxID=1658519 RepID=A0ABQ4NAY6_9BACL|nr:hypothetical protein PACILC2_39470 [Paenibacillus cisolokensis]
MPGLTQLVRFDSPGLQTFRAVACLSVKKFEGVIRLRMNWYYRMMLSYTPIFFVAVSSLIIVFFTMLNNASEKNIWRRIRRSLSRLCGIRMPT